MKLPQTLKLFLLLTALPVFCLASSTSDPKLNTTMNSLAHQMQELFPLIFMPDDKVLKDEAKITEKVNQLNKTFIAAKPHIDQETIAFKASYKVMLEHLQSTEKLLKDKKPLLATKNLKILPSLCVSCHTQDAKQQAYFVGMDRSHFNSDFQFAEFSFATRDYGTAITYYDKYLTTPGSFKSEERMSTALERLLTLYVQVDHEPKLAATYLNEYLPFIVDYPNLKVELNEWVKELNNVSPYYQDVLSGKRELDFQSLKSLAQALEDEPASNEHPVHFIILRGLIYQHLNEAPKKEEIPALLYWLALADKKLNYQYYYSFADVYLKECFTQFPKDPYANLCKKEYQSYSTVG